jgi:hypothetical protein
VLANRAQPGTRCAQLLPRRAVDAFARAAQLAPHHPDPLTSWAEVALWQGKPQEAITLGQRQAALADWRRAMADPQAGHRGETAASLALAEATWAHLRCQAVADARTALAASSISISDTITMREIMHVDGPLCARVSGGQSDAQSGLLRWIRLPYHPSHSLLPRVTLDQRTDVHEVGHGLAPLGDDLLGKRAARYRH